MDFNDFWHKYSWHNWPSNGSLSSHLTQRLFLHYLGKTEQTKYALKWTTNVNKLEIRSHKNLMTAVWANEVHRLLTAVLPAIKRVAGDTFVFQWYCASAHRLAKRSNCWSAKPQTSSLRICGPNSPDLNPVDYKIWGSCNSRSIKRRSRMRMDSRSNWLKSGIGLEQNIIDTAINKWRKRLHACVRAKGRHFEKFTVGSWTTGRLDKLSARVTEM